jgi:uncharacterized protein (DUF2147 family)
MAWPRSVYGDGDLKQRWIVLRTVLLLGLCGAGMLAAQTTGVLGTWTEPTGSAIEVYHCGAAICARLVAISPQASSRVDINNPDAKLQKIPLCGLVVGQGFHLSGPGQADGGHLYDPKSGKTYSGSMSSDGNQLELRGYVGIELFGRTETWTRARQGLQRCDRVK